MGFNNSKFKLQYSGKLQASISSHGGQAVDFADGHGYFLVGQFSGVLAWFQHLIEAGTRAGEGRVEPLYGFGRRVNVPIFHTQPRILRRFGKKARFSETGNAFGGMLKR